MLGFYRFALETVPVNRALLVLTLLAFGAQQYVGQAATLAGARFNVAIDRGGQWHRLVTPMFLHGGAATGFVLGLAVAPSVSRRSGADGDGSLVPPPVTQGLLLATLLVVAVALRDGVQLATLLRPRLR